MELVSIEEARVISMVSFHRPAGQLYLPEATTKLIQRYSFAKFPTLEDLTKIGEFASFGIGKFADTQIHEFQIYNDGVIVIARSNSNVLDAFIEDLYAWTKKEFGTVVVTTPQPERYYESTLVVRASKDLTTVMGLPSEIVENFNSLMSQMTYKTPPFLKAGFLLDCDSTELKSRRKPTRFVVDRRAGIAFDKNVFFSQAPLATDDHLAFLERLEGLAR